MIFNSQLLYHLLNEQYSLTKHGRSIRGDLDLALPVFYNRNVQLISGAVYITRTQDLPSSCNAECLFVCLGPCPPRLYNSWLGEVFYISNQNMDIRTLFNTVIGFYDQILRWDRAMQQLLKSSAEIEEFVRISLPIFNNCISITDYNLCLLVNCGVVEDEGRCRVEISREFDRIPDSIGASFQNKHLQYIKFREPFTYKGQKENPDGENYCINLYLNNTYIGSCTLWEKLHPMRESDFLLFQQFAEYIQEAISSASPFQAGSLVTLKSIFGELLQRFPVSAEEQNAAVSLLEADMSQQGITFGEWQCLVIHSANRGKTLPEQYICSSVEEMLPNATVLSYEGNIVCFCVIPQGETCEETVLDILLPYLKDMNFRVGVSEAFGDIFDAYNYYRQAQILLETGFRLSEEQYVYRFADYVLPYMLMNSVGTFTPDMMFSQGLKRLQADGSGVDYWDTLKQYLDNECNASRTTQDLYLHRSSLFLRLKKIQSYVEMDTPEQRLYLRICLYLKQYWGGILDHPI